MFVLWGKRTVFILHMVSHQHPPLNYYFRHANACKEHLWSSDYYQNVFQPLEDLEVASNIYDID